jgi:hypothetical protein
VPCVVPLIGASPSTSDGCVAMQHLRSCCL